MARNKRAKNNQERANITKAKDREEDLSPFAGIVLKEKQPKATKQNPNPKTDNTSKRSSSNNSQALTRKKPSEIVQGYDPSSSFADILYNWEHTGNPYALPDKGKVRKIGDEKTSFAEIFSKWEKQSGKKENSSQTTHSNYKRVSQPYKAQKSFADILSAFEGEAPLREKSKQPEEEAKAAPVPVTDGKEEVKPTTFFKEMDEDDEIPTNVSWSVYSGSRDIERPEIKEEEEKEKAKEEPKKKKAHHTPTRDFASILSEFEGRKLEQSQQHQTQEQEGAEEEAKPQEEEKGTTSLFKEMEEDDEIPSNVAWSVFSGSRDIERSEPKEEETDKLPSMPKPAKAHKNGHIKAKSSPTFIKSVEEEKVKSFDEILKEKGDLEHLKKEWTITQLRLMMPQATLDLHGMSASEAESALKAFIEDCQNVQLEKIAVIHGKGLHSDGGHGVLKEVCINTLNSLSCYREYTAAKPAYGGSGVLWVILKKRI